jgi:hypothetical protein
MSCTAPHKWEEGAGGPGPTPAHGTSLNLNAPYQHQSSAFFSLQRTAMMNTASAATSESTLVRAVARSQDRLEACLPLPKADPAFRDALYWHVILARTALDVPAAVRRCRRPETLAGKLVDLGLKAESLEDAFSALPLEGEHHRLIPGEGAVLSFPERAAMVGTPSSAPALLAELMEMWDIRPDAAAEAGAALRTTCGSRMLSARDELQLATTDGTARTLRIKRRGAMVIADLAPQLDITPAQAEPTKRAAEPTLAPMTALLRSRLGRPNPAAPRLAA